MLSLLRFNDLMAAFPLDGASLALCTKHRGTIHSEKQKKPQQYIS